jgi:cation transport ATPase
MQNQNLTKEQKAIRNILYGIIALTISVSFIVDFYALIDPKNKYLINISIIVIYGIVFYIGYKNQLLNKTAAIFTIILVAIIVTYTLLKR